jgi:hypothetical protein
VKIYSTIYSCIIACKKSPGNGLIELCHGLTHLNCLHCLLDLWLGVQTCIQSPMSWSLGVAVSLAYVHLEDAHLFKSLHLYDFRVYLIDTLASPHRRED